MTFVEMENAKAIAEDLKKIKGHIDSTKNAIERNSFTKEAQEYLWNDTLKKIGTVLELATF